MQLAVPFMAGFGFWGLAPLLSRKRTEEETQRRRERWNRLGVSVTLKEFYCKIFGFNLKSIV